MNPTLVNLLEGIAAGLLVGLSAGIADQLSGGTLRHSELIAASGSIPLLLAVLGYGQVQGMRARAAAAAVGGTK